MQYKIWININGDVCRYSCCSLLCICLIVGGQVPWILTILARLSKQFMQAKDSIYIYVYVFIYVRSSYPASMEKEFAMLCVKHSTDALFRLI